MYIYIMIIYFDNGRFALSKTQLICYIIKVDIEVTEQFSLFSISPFCSPVEMQFVYKIVCLNLTSVYCQPHSQLLSDIWLHLKKA